MAISLPIVSSFDNRGLRRAKDALRGFGNFAADIGKIAAGAVAAVAVAGVREAAEFETSIAKIEGLVGVAGDELDVLAQSAKDLAPSFGASANEAAEALFFITSAGLRGSSAIEVLEASLKGSAIGLGETKTIADLATSAVNAYGEAQLGGAEAVDVLAEAVRLGKLEPEELAASMGQVLPLASELGIGFDQVGAAMAGMSKTGTNASTASTQLRQIMTTLVKPTAEANDALADMGLSAEGLREQIREEGLFATLETLTDAFDGNIEATSEVFGNVRALSGVLDLMGESADDNRELFRLMGDDIKVTDEAMEAMSDTAQFKFDESMGNVKNSLIDIGDNLKDRLTPRLDQFNDWMVENGPEIEQAFSNIFDVVENLAIGLGDFVTDLAENEKFQEFLTNIQDWFADTWPLVEDLVVNLGDLALALTPLLTTAIEETLPFVRDLASIMGDLLFFINESTTAMENMGLEIPNWTGVIESNLNPIERLKDLVNGVAIALNKAREAWEKFTGSGAPDDLIPGPTQNRTGGVLLPAPQTRATGGPVQAGQSYLIGERGAEMFVPRQDGSIVPNHGLGGGGGGDIYITVNAGMGTNGPQVGEEIVAAIKRYERSSGRVFQSA